MKNTDHRIRDRNVAQRPSETIFLLANGHFPEPSYALTMSTAWRSQFDEYPFQASSWPGTYSVCISTGEGEAEPRVRVGGSLDRSVLHSKPPRPSRTPSLCLLPCHIIPCPQPPQCTDSSPPWPTIRNSYSGDRWDRYTVLCAPSVPPEVPPTQRRLTSARSPDQSYVLTKHCSAR